MLIIVRVGLGFSWPAAVKGARLGVAGLSPSSPMPHGGRQDGNMGYRHTAVSLNVVTIVETRTETDFALPQASIKRDRDGDIRKASGECI